MMNSSLTEQYILETSENLQKLEDLWFTARAKLPLHMRRDAKTFLIGLEEQKLFWKLRHGYYGYKFGWLGDVKVLFSNEPTEARALCEPYHYE